MPEITCPNPGLWHNEGARIEVVESFNGFYIYDLNTGGCRGMGDGVDMFTDYEGKSATVGTPLFYEYLSEMVERGGHELREAYFEKETPTGSE